VIKEFAVEPELMATWDYFRMLWPDFGFCRGRVISDFPRKRWRKRVIDAAGSRNRPVVAAAIRERMIQPTEWEPRVVDFHRPYPDATREWLENAESSHGTVPFHLILALSNPRAHLRVITAQSLDRSDVRYTVQLQLDNIPRRAEDIALAVDGLARHTTTLTFIDPYFRPAYRAYTKVIIAIIEKAAAAGAQLTAINIHSRDESGSVDSTREERAIELELLAYIPTGCTLKMFYWTERAGGEQFHSRHILFDHCGVQLDPGLDEKAANFTQIILMEDHRLATLRQKFDPATAVYDQCCNPIERIG
jgi:hypothetical protein